MKPHKKKMISHQIANINKEIEIIKKGPNINSENEKHNIWGNKREKYNI